MSSPYTPSAVVASSGTTTSAPKMWIFGNGENSTPAIKTMGVLYSLTPSAITTLGMPSGTYQFSLGYQYLTSPLGNDIANGGGINIGLTCVGSNYLYSGTENLYSLSQSQGVNAAPSSYAGAFFSGLFVLDPTQSNYSGLQVYFINPNYNSGNASNISIYFGGYKSIGLHMTYLGTSLPTVVA